MGRSVWSLGDGGRYCDVMTRRPAFTWSPLTDSVWLTFRENLFMSRLSSSTHLLVTMAPPPAVGAHQLLALYQRRQIESSRSKRRLAERLLCMQLPPDCPESCWRGRKVIHTDTWWGGDDVTLKQQGVGSP